ncbi:MAG TPA: ABC transporter ATP-binding protein [Candidatus Paceibacterota bacterium]
MNYTLNDHTSNKKELSTWTKVKKLGPLVAPEKTVLIWAFIALIANSVLNLATPLVIGRTIDKYIATKDFHGVLISSGLLLGLYLLALVASYLQTSMMGGVGQRSLFALRNSLFNKLQSLPIAFFNQNKAGDLISRLNNDTDKVNQFFSQSLMQFLGSIFIMIGAGIFLLSINVRLGLITLVPALFILLFNQIVSPWVKKRNAANSASTGTLSAEIQESLENFKVVVAFNRRDYFRDRFDEVNHKNYDTAVKAGNANNLFTPVYGFASNIAHLGVLVFGILMIIQGEFTVGLLISFLSYATNFYNPLRQLAALWANFQVAMAGWDRISDILALESDMATLPKSDAVQSKARLEFKKVSFTYSSGKEVLKDANLTLEAGKTYALVGPTGGGKTTTASLMARLFDPSNGTVFLNGHDIRTYSADERARHIGFILQEPFLFSGTIRENIVYGNEEYQNHTSDELAHVIHDAGLEQLLERFQEGLDTAVSLTGDAMSLGQKQLIAFMRAILRKPDILILDEATANIDTITEQLLEDILKNLPASTTRVIIAHRLNTIESADEIFFVNNTHITSAGSFDHAVSMLLHGHKTS